MVLSFFSGGAESVADLIARKKYAKAIELLRAEFKQGSRDPRVRLQLADVMILAGRGKEAVPILLGLADEFALEGFAAKAISVLKKVQKVDPTRRDVEGKLAKLIKDKTRDPPTSGVRPKQAAPDFGMEEIGMEASPVSTTEAPPPAPAVEPGEAAPAAELEPPGLAEFQLQADDLVITEDPEPAPDAPAEALGDELIGMLEDVLKENPAAATPAQPAPGRPRPAADSPLFSSFSQEELVAVMHGLRLLSFGPGDILLTEGEAGDSLFVLTSGVVKAFVRNPAGKNIPVREMAEGTFFGEISILSGRPRTATVTAVTACDLLELDRATLDSISQTHPHVREVLKQFYEERVKSEQDRKARSGKT